MAARHPIAVPLRKSEFEQPLVAVDIVVFSMREDGLCALLVRRAIDPFRGHWAIPGGFVLASETLDAAALRELREETGVRIPHAYLEQLYTFGAPRRDPRGRIISVAYLGLVDGAHVAPRGGSDASVATWHTLDALPKLAFDHAEIIVYALQRLRYKLEYTNVAYALLPEIFTFAELQAVYESVLGKALDKRNFQKKMRALAFVQPTRQWRRREQGRPARLWRFTQREPIMVKTFVAKA